jgi:cell fate regulator YaaT (PSP1 superfamily)
MDSNNNQLAQEAEIIRLNSIIDVMQIDLDGLEQEKASAIKAFNNYKVKIEEERLEHKRSEAENLQLDKRISELTHEKDALQKTIDELGESLDL